MKFLKSLLGIQPAEPPVWDIKPQSERPVAKKADAAKENVLPSGKAAGLDDDNPFMDEALDTIQLEAEDTGDDDPYQTHTWQMDQRDDTRSMKAVDLGTKTDKSAPAKFNPYDTGSNRRGWK
jgi:hypothetical protein